MKAASARRRRGTGAGAVLAAVALATAGAVLVASRAVSAGGPPPNAKKAPAPKPRAPANVTPEQVAEARQAFEHVARVLLSPRCKNCHPAGDRPLQTDRGRPHRMNISRRSPEVGLKCTACHRERNARAPGGPPGAPHWNMPPRETPMVFEGRTARQLCEQLKDPARTGGRDLDALVAHVQTDSLVLWAWSPGPGRTTPPGTHAELVEAVTRWAAAGGPCP